MRAVPRGPKGWPILGNLPEVGRDPLAFWQRLQREHFGVTRFTLGFTELVAINDPETVEAVLVGQHRACVKDSITRDLEPLIGESILTTDGEPWRMRRKLAAQPFAPKHIAAYADSMVAAAQKHVAAYADGETRDFHRDIMALTLEVVGQAMLGFDTHSDADRIARAMDEAIPYFEGILFTFAGQRHRYLPTLTRLRFERAKRDLDRVVADIVARAQAQGDADFMLARLARARDEDGLALSPQELANEAITYLLAGHETTATTIMFAVYALSQQPSAATALRRELDQVLGERTVTMADLPQLPYLQAVVKETLRLYPAAPVFGREVAIPFFLNGMELRRGVQLVFPAFAIQRDARFFSEPDTFVPERFLGDALQDLPKFAYFPFGGGPRVCIGQHFAVMEAQLLLATILQAVDLQPVPGFEMVMSPVVTLRSRNGLPVQIRRRSQQERQATAAQAPAAERALTAT